MITWVIDLRRRLRIWNDESMRWFEIKMALLFASVCIGMSFWAYYSPEMRQGPMATLIFVSLFGALLFGVGRSHHGDG
jgi:hypothetical protein